METGADGGEQEIIGGFLLPPAGGDDGPEAFAGRTAFDAAGALGDHAVDHHKADRLFGRIVGRVDAGGGDEADCSRVK